MESRLRQPKIFSPQIDTTDTTTRMEKQKEKDSQIIPTEKSTFDNPTKATKAKNMLNVNSKCINENKPPANPRLERSKTMSTINPGAKSLKRPGTAPLHNSQAKKPLIKPIAKTIVSQRNCAAATTSKTNLNIATKKTQNTCTTVKPSKWDLKGRLAYTSGELSDMRQKYDETTSKYNELELEVNTFKTNEKIYKKKTQEMESLNKLLDSELGDLKEEMSKIHQEREDLTKRLLESEKSYKNVSTMLNELKYKYAVREELFSKQSEELQDLKTNLKNAKRTNKKLSTRNNDLQLLVHKMDRESRILHNTVQELKGNIRVFCRVRPKTDKEASKPLCSINFIDECTIEVGKSDGSDAVSCSGRSRGTVQEFSFDKIFPPNATQQDVFEELSLLVQSALEGYNVCVFAYGQTGSGKTYTMEGMPDPEIEGMIPRTVQHIFQEMKDFQLLGWEYRIEASFLEIYNEHIVDLLDSNTKTHEIRMADNKGHDLYVTNLKVEEIQNSAELMECLLTAQRNRAVAATRSNERSSRSHSVARIKLIGTHRAKEEVCVGNLNLVDLAGSERLRGEEKVRLTETKNINKSLANLGNVILALLKKQEHVPYRNSKLTHLLMPSLGGNSKTLMLLNISPLDECYNETLNSLRFASNVNNCKISNVKRTKTVLQSAA